MRLFRRKKWRIESVSKWCPVCKKWIKVWRRDGKRIEHKHKEPLSPAEFTVLVVGTYYGVALMLTMVIMYLFG